MAFCTENPQEPICVDARPIAQVEMTKSRQELLELVLSRTRLNFHNETTGDRWEVSRNGDCEDNVLWQMREIRERDPEMARAMRPILIRGPFRNRTHLVLGIETTQGVVVVNVVDRELQRWSSDWEAYAPELGIGGSWTPYAVALNVNESSVASASD